MVLSGRLLLKKHLKALAILEGVDFCALYSFRCWISHFLVWIQTKKIAAIITVQFFVNNGVVVGNCLAQTK